MKKGSAQKKLTTAERETLLATLRTRFDKNMPRHHGVAWAAVAARLASADDKLWSLHEMERTGGEPDVTACDGKSGVVTFTDCAPQSPEGRTGYCYDREGLESRKEHRPKNTVIDAADEMGAELLDEQEYRALQLLGEFDTKSSSWVKTPPEVRKLGGALFCDRRYGRVFVYHNGAQSYYSGRGFRTSLKI